jgi:ribosomal protein S3
MGQKVHPLGLRVGITKKHQSQWFARFHKNKYAQSILEDRMLRQTLTNIFPQLINPVLKKQRHNEASIAPKITQIKIERGLIPYEIGIQIHAENCDFLKSSVENLKLNREFMCQLQKTRRYLQHLRSKLNESSDSLDTSEKTKLSDSENNENRAMLDNVGSPGDRRLRGLSGVSFSEKPFEKKSKELEFRGQSTRGLRGSKVPKLTKQELRRQRLILRRLKKRQLIRSRYKQLVREARFFLTKQGKKILQQLNIRNERSSRGLEVRGSRDKKFSMTSKAAIRGEKTKNSTSILRSRGTLNKTDVSGSTGAQKGRGVTGSSQKSYNLFQSRLKKKFVSIYRKRMNKKFLQVLKDSILAYQNSVGENESQEQMSRDPRVSSKHGGSGAKSGSISAIASKKWNFQLVQPRLANKPLSKLMNLVSLLEQKSLRKMEYLRKDFLTFGTISAGSYYQMLRFLKDLKDYVNQIRRKQRLQFLLQNSEKSKRKENLSLELRQPQVQKFTNSNFNLVLSKKLNNIENECRKIQFIEYLKQVVKKHRTDNISLYLATISEARKDLRKLKQFTKKHASFLFGAFPSEEQEDKQKLKIQERVRLVLENSQSKTDLDKTLQDIFLEQIEKQRNMFIDNVQLTPKIAIKFYNVKERSVKAKASIVADYVVDALEQRSSFRKVIKQVKEDLMRTPSTNNKTNRIKGLKIQVSGRLNGSEIARSEWIRAGRVPLSTLRANLDYSYKTANTIYGIIGVKVWIFKGYTKLL